MRIHVVYKPVNVEGVETLPTAMNWEGKMTLPKSWYDEPVSKLTEYVCDVYNERHPDLSTILKLDASSYFLAKHYRALGYAERIRDVIERGDHLHIVEGPPQPQRDPALVLPRF